jgi:hypothetical protein
MKKLLPPALIFLVSAVYFGLQACPTFYFWDSAELTAAVLGGGVPHPPGFPLLLILARIWVAAVPLQASGGLNLFSSFLAALGIAIWFTVITRVMKESMVDTGRGIISLFSLIPVLVMGISVTYSIQATRFEVYSLNFVCFAVLVLIALKIASTDHPSSWPYYALFALIGIAMVAHILTIALVIPGILLLLYKYNKISLKRIVPAATLAVLLMMILYFFLYYLARQHPPLNWGDPCSLRKFYNYIFIREFTASASSFNPGHIIDNLWFVVSLLSGQLGAAGLILSVWGFIYLVRAKSAIALPLAIILFLNSFSIVFSQEFFLENYDLHGYLMVSLAIVTLLTAVGLLRMYISLAKLIKRCGTDHPEKLALVASLIIAVLIFAVPAKHNILAADLSGVEGARDYSGQFLEGAPGDALIITSYYNTYFCLQAYKAAFASVDEHPILNVYNWDHKWGKEEINRRFQKKLPIDIDRQSFYRHFLNEFMKKSPIYVEYDEASAPLVKYLKPNGLGYVLTTTDTSMAGIDTITGEIEARLKAVSALRNIESIKIWLLWFQNRGSYYKHRGYPEAATAYFSAVDSVAALVPLNR